MGSGFTAAAVARLQRNRAAHAPRNVPNDAEAAAGAAVAVVAPTKRKPRHLEDDMQAQCVAWYRYQYAATARLLFAIPNGGNRNAREGARLKGQGVTAGVPDTLLAVPVPPYAGLFLELKVGRNRPSPEQVAMLAALTAQGYRCAVVYSLAEFMAEIKAYLGR